MGPLIGSAEAALSAPHDGSYGGATLAPYHEAIALAGVVKAQLLSSDFHFV
jgi:hypothetical protein